MYSDWPLMQGSLSACENTSSAENTFARVSRNNFRKRSFTVRPWDVPHAVYVSQVPSSISREDVKSYCETFGLTKCVFVPNLPTGPQTYAIVIFCSSVPVNRMTLRRSHMIRGAFVTVEKYDEELAKAHKPHERKGPSAFSVQGPDDIIAKRTDTDERATATRAPDSLIVDGMLDPALAAGSPSFVKMGLMEPVEDKPNLSGIQTTSASSLSQVEAQLSELRQSLKLSCATSMMLAMNKNNNSMELQPEQEQPKVPSTDEIHSAAGRVFKLLSRFGI